MSIITCDGCDAWIDTDFDPASYDEKSDEWLCESCRKAEDEFEEGFNFSFGTPPHKLHRTDAVETSVEAAHAVDTSHLERMVYEAIKYYGPQGCIAADLLRKFHHHPYSSITARFAALERKGLIERGGLTGKEKRQGPSGRNQLVMRSLL